MRGGGEFPGDHDIGWQRDLRAAGTRLVHQAAGDIEHLGLTQGFADAEPGRGEEGIGNAAAHDQLVHTLQQRFEHHQLGGYL